MPPSGRAVVPMDGVPNLTLKPQRQMIHPHVSAVLRQLHALATRLHRRPFGPQCLIRTEVIVTQVATPDLIVGFTDSHLARATEIEQRAVMNAVRYCTSRQRWKRCLRAQTCFLGFTAPFGFPKDSVVRHTQSSDQRLSIGTANPAIIEPVTRPPS